MDRTSWIGAGACVVLLIAYFSFFSPSPQPATPQTSGQTAGENQPTQNQNTVSGGGESTGQPLMAASSEAGIIMEEASEAVAPAPVNLEPAQEVVLENEFVRVVLTEDGGAILRVELKEHTAEGDEPVILNRGAEKPLLNLSGLNSGQPVQRYMLSAESNDEVVIFRRILGSGLVLDRQYSFEGDYRIKLDQTLYNQGGQLAVIPQYRMDLGTVTSVYGNADEQRFVGGSWLTHSGKYKEGKLSSFKPSFMGLFPAKTIVTSEDGDTVQWAALKTQFFATIINMEETLASDIQMKMVMLPDLREAKGTAVPEGVEVSVALPGYTIEPSASFHQSFTVYAGPKQYDRIVEFPFEQDRILDFGWMRWISGPMLWLMVGIHGFVGNYGIAIIILTMILRGVLWWPQTLANRSMKRMQVVSPLLKELQEKYKDKPEKLNKEMLKLYQDYGVNPVGGCFPMLLQFPIFLGFFYMLQGAVELRHESFLWIEDLAQPDTVFVIPGLDFPINLMPLIMAGTMYYTMSMTPTPQGVDNPMFKIMKFMPVMFLLFCYNYASALSVYWTMQNVLSMVQMKYNLKQEPPSLEAMKKETIAKRKARKERTKGFGNLGK
ncbi:MAG: membrane protein insertase YidC [Verrucomicrobiota bacterium]